MRTLKKALTAVTLPASPVQSLFKYVLLYNTERGEGMPGVAYSMDKPSERELFYRGLSLDHRKTWKTFIEAFDDEYYNFFGCVYPSFIDEKVEMYFINSHDNVDFLKTLSTDQVSQLQNWAAACGISSIKLTPIATNHKGPKPHITPKYYKDKEELNGMVAVRRWLMKQFQSKGLVEIRVYDNLAYHSDNEITRWTLEAPKLDIPTPPKYKTEPKSMAELTAHFQAN